MEFLSFIVTFVLDGNRLSGGFVLDGNRRGGNKEPGMCNPGSSILLAFQMISHSTTLPLFKSQTSNTKKIMERGHQESL